MNSKLLSTFFAAAVALIASASFSQAVVYSPSQFNTELKLKIGTKTGSSAFKAAASFYKAALGDKKNKKYAAKYATLLVKALKKPVKSSLQGKSTAALVKALFQGYFKSFKFNLSDKIYNQALDILLKKLPLSQKTAITSQLIYNTLKAEAIKKGESQLTIFQYYLDKALLYNLPAPSVS